MAKQGRLIIVDDNRGILSAVKLLTEKHFASVVGLSSPNLLISELRLQGPCRLFINGVDHHTAHGAVKSVDGIDGLSKLA